MITPSRLFSALAILFLLTACGNVFRKDYTRIADDYVLGLVYGGSGIPYYYITHEPQKSGVIIVPWGIEQMAITRRLIYGRCHKVIFPPEEPDFFKGVTPEPFDGFFIINRISGKVLLDIPEDEFRDTIGREGVAWPPAMYEPRKWLR